MSSPLLYSTPPARSIIPAISEWQLFGGGTFAPPESHSYSLLTDWGGYYVDPEMVGRRVRYIVRFCAYRGDGQSVGDVKQAGLWRELGEVSRAASGPRIAREHAVSIGRAH